MATKVTIGTAVQAFLRTLTAEKLESLLRIFVRSLSGCRSCGPKLLCESR